MEHKPNPRVESAFANLSAYAIVFRKKEVRQILQQLFDAGVEAGIEAERQRAAVAFAKTGGPAKTSESRSIFDVMTVDSRGYFTASAPSIPVREMTVQGDLGLSTFGWVTYTGDNRIQITLYKSRQAIDVIHQGDSFLIQGPVGAGRGRVAEHIAKLTGLRIHDGEWLSDAMPPAGVIALQPPKNIHGEFDCPFNGQAAV